MKINLNVFIIIGLSMESYCILLFVYLYIYWNVFLIFIGIFL